MGISFFKRKTTTVPDKKVHNDKEPRSTIYFITTKIIFIYYNHLILHSFLFAIKINIESFPYDKPKVLLLYSTKPCKFVMVSSM